eukprot:g3531.t1
MAPVNRKNPASRSDRGPKGNNRNLKKGKKSKGGAGAENAGNRAPMDIISSRFYNDNAPGRLFEPTHVLVLSLCFIAVVVLMHIWGRFRS